MRYVNPLGPSQLDDPVVWVLAAVVALGGMGLAMYGTVRAWRRTKLTPAQSAWRLGLAVVFGVALAIFAMWLF